MFDNKELDERGEVPAPFNVEKHNFSPHAVRGEFDFDRNGRAIVRAGKGIISGNSPQKGSTKVKKGGSPGK